MTGVNLPALKRLEVETRGHDLLSGAETDLILAQLPSIIAALERAERLEAAARAMFRAGGTSKAAYGELWDALEPKP